MSSQKSTRCASSVLFDMAVSLGFCRYSVAMLAHVPPGWLDRKGVSTMRYVFSPRPRANLFVVFSSALLSRKTSGCPIAPLLALSGWQLRRGRGDPFSSARNQLTRSREGTSSNPEGSATVQPSLPVGPSTDGIIAAAADREPLSCLLLSLRFRFQTIVAAVPCARLRRG